MIIASSKDSPARLPSWFFTRLTTNDSLAELRMLVRNNRLHTVCDSAACPNRTECWNAGTATFMILGNVCTRGCRFCAVSKGAPEKLDIEEPNRVADAVQLLGLRYSVITSVTRDDLPDGGASVFAQTIHAIRARLPKCTIEVLIPDFKGSEHALRTVLEAGPDVLNHNIETVPSLYASVRPQAGYQRSLELLARAHTYGAVTKSGLMLGLGEGIEEIRSVTKDLQRAGCSILTMGQYLQPNRRSLAVKKYYQPDEFDALRAEAISMGIRHVVSGPRVRSSYHAEEHTRCNS
jgi:lipoic acid synthetase